MRMSLRPEVLTNSLWDPCMLTKKHEKGELISRHRSACRSSTRMSMLRAYHIHIWLLTWRSNIAIMLCYHICIWGIRRDNRHVSPEGHFIWTAGHATCHIVHFKLPFITFSSSICSTPWLHLPPTSHHHERPFVNSPRVSPPYY